MPLLDRLTGAKGFDKIGIHGFNAALCEYARGKLSKIVVATNYEITGNDFQAQAIIGLIDDETTVESKVIKASEICDVLILHEGRDSNAFYPNAQSIATRLGV